MAGMVDEHSTLVLAARLYKAVHSDCNLSDVTQKDAVERQIEWCDYSFERPVYNTMVADVKAIVRNALKELGRRSFRDGRANED